MAALSSTTVLPSGISSSSTSVTSHSTASLVQGSKSLNSEHIAFILGVFRLKIADKESMGESYIHLRERSQKTTEQLLKLQEDLEISHKQLEEITGNIERDTERLKKMESGLEQEIMQDENALTELGREIRISSVAVPVLLAEQLVNKNKEKTEKESILKGVKEKLQAVDLGGKRRLEEFIAQQKAEIDQLKVELNRLSSDLASQTLERSKIEREIAAFNKGIKTFASIDHGVRESLCFSLLELELMMNTLKERKSTLQRELNLSEAELNKIIHSTTELERERTNIDGQLKDLSQEEANLKLSLKDKNAQRDELKKQMKTYTSQMIALQKGMPSINIQDMNNDRQLLEMASNLTTYTTRRIELHHQKTVISNEIGSQVRALEETVKKIADFTQQRELLNKRLEEDNTKKEKIQNQIRGVKYRQESLEKGVGYLNEMQLKTEDEPAVSSRSVPGSFQSAASSIPKVGVQSGSFASLIAGGVTKSASVNRKRGSSIVLQVGGGKQARTDQSVTSKRRNALILKAARGHRLHVEGEGPIPIDKEPLNFISREFTVGSLHHLIKSRETLRLEDIDHYLAGKNRTDIVLELSKLESGCNPLHVLIQRCDARLLSHGVNACEIDVLIKVIEKYKPKLNFATEDEWTPLELICQNNCFNNAFGVNLIKALAGLDCILEGSSTRRPLSLCVYKQHNHLAIALIECGARINDYDAFGFAPIHYITMVGNKEMLKRFIDNYNLYRRTHPYLLSTKCLVSNATPLMYTCDFAQLECTNLLLDGIGKIEIEADHQDKFNRTALDCLYEPIETSSSQELRKKTIDFMMRHGIPCMGRPIDLN